MHDVPVAIISAVAPTITSLAAWYALMKRTNGSGPIAERCARIEERLARIEERLSD